MSFKRGGFHADPSHRSTAPNSHPSARRAETQEQQRGSHVLSMIRLQQERERARYAAEHYRDSSEPWKKLMTAQYIDGTRADFPHGHPDTDNNGVGLGQHGA